MARQRRRGRSAGDDSLARGVSRTGHRQERTRVDPYNPGSMFSSPAIRLEQLRLSVAPMMDWRERQLVQ